MSDKTILPDAIRPFFKEGDPSGSVVPPGWFDIVERMHANIIKVEPTYQIEQIKEKFGLLRVYVDTEHHPDSLVYIIINYYESMSRRICQFCGSEHPSVSQDVKNNWIVTRCNACRENN